MFEYNSCGVSLIGEVLDRISIFKRRISQDMGRDISELVGKCRFSDCRHITEPGCAVKQAIENHSLSQAQRKLYCSLMVENNWGTEKISVKTNKLR